MTAWTSRKLRLTIVVVFPAPSMDEACHRSSPPNVRDHVAFQSRVGAAASPGPAAPASRAATRQPAAARPPAARARIVSLPRIFISP